ncbi:hypothetical protein Amac_091360 [Acrocarpospora macrocephala]|uniref:Uncharacterized protein n=1 Tax=Acrocarpospora macrocephala TaxID=150177 RepID=A0A5M3X5W0_9ACTN|nr:VIT1/CCC1 transporter family protein [Acrocarpospora macrocephala]GES15539.1 hypothetical protein Amac_091360 [Acrocarpospora macrocephala]
MTRSAASMAGGAYVSLAGRREPAQAEIGVERHELERHPKDEQDELAQVHVSRSVDPTLARRISRSTENPALVWQVSRGAENPAFVWQVSRGAENPAFVWQVSRGAENPALVRRASCGAENPALVRRISRNPEKVLLVGGVATALTGGLGSIIGVGGV